MKRKVCTGKRLESVTASRKVYRKGEITWNRQSIRRRCSCVTYQAGVVALLLELRCCCCWLIWLAIWLITIVGSVLCFWVKAWFWQSQESTSSALEHARHFALVFWVRLLMYGRFVDFVFALVFWVDFFPVGPIAAGSALEHARHCWKEINSKN